MIDFEKKLHFKTLSIHLMSIAVAKKVLLENVFEFADREVDGTPSCGFPFAKDFFFSSVNFAMQPIIRCSGAIQP